VDVDQSTCYDLGLEKEAAKGEFENQTHLNLPFFKRFWNMPMDETYDIIIVAQALPDQRSPCGGSERRKGPAP